MVVARYVLNAIYIVLAVIIIAVVLLQAGKQAGLSGSIAGGAETFFGRNKGRTLDAKLAKMTKWVAIFFLIISIALQLIITRLY